MASNEDALHLINDIGLRVNEEAERWCSQKLSLDIAIPRDILNNVQYYGIEHC